jgi:2,3-diaminopropionate biosynthesis protein SbnB
MSNNSIRTLNAHEIAELLRGREKEIVDEISLAYQTHGNQMSAIPQSVFLRFPENSTDRIIALPAYLGGDFNVAGIKWISSFPGNINRGKDRASAVIILNSLEDGWPEAFLEGAVISAQRTAAGAALAARTLRKSPSHTCLAVIGCGVINYEIVRFIAATCPELVNLTVYDKDPGRASGFANRCRSNFEELEVKIVSNLDDALAGAPLISIATTASAPHIADLSACPKDALLLHISLRDISAETILTCENVTDDVDHVCRENTSLHLAEKLSGNRDFINGALPDILLGRVPAHAHNKRTIFSPFGLGILDLALAKLVLNLARDKGVGTVIESFVAEPRLS